MIAGVLVVAFADLLAPLIVAIAVVAGVLLKKLRDGRGIQKKKDRPFIGS